MGEAMAEVEVEVEVAKHTLPWTTSTFLFSNGPAVRLACYQTEFPGHNSSIVI